MTNIKKRIAVSLFANCFRGGSTLLVGILLARFLGSNDYGTLVFLIATSTAVKQFLDLGTSSAFFTFLSRETRSIKFLIQFWIFFFAKYIVTVLIIFFILPSFWLNKIWLGNSTSVIVIALMAVAFQADFWVIASQMLESQRKTVRVQILFVLAQLIHFGLIFGFHYFGILTIPNYLMCIGVLWFVIGLIASVSYRPARYLFSSHHKTVSIQEYIKYCAPIAPIIMLNFAAEFLDKWMLQNWGGASQQAYLAIAIQIASVTLLITASFIKILWKEVAEALHENRLKEAIDLYLGARKAVFYCAAFIATACIPWANEILQLFYGSTYYMAAISLVLLLVYSIHQSIGQVDSAFLMASGKTGIGFKISAILAPIGLFFSYWFISDGHGLLIGLGLGAAGLAMKMVIAQLISVNTIGLLIQQEFNLKLKYFYQLQVFLIFICIAFIVKMALMQFFTGNIFVIFVSFVLQLSLSALIALKFPRVLALSTNWLLRSKDFLTLTSPRM